MSDNSFQLTEVSLQDSNPRDYDAREHVEGMWDFKKALQDRPLRFAFLDGRVEGVCAEPGEETWVLNIKKSILSGFQNTMESLQSSTTTTEVSSQKHKSRNKCIFWRLTSSTSA